MTFHLNTLPSLAETLITFFFRFVNPLKSCGFIAMDSGRIVFKDAKRHLCGSKRIESILDGHSYKGFAQTSTTF